MNYEFLQKHFKAIENFRSAEFTRDWNLDDFYSDNNENIAKGIDNYIEKLQELKKALNDKNGDKLYQIFNSTRDIRKEIIKAGQDTSKPDFGRKKD